MGEHTHRLQEKISCHNGEDIFKSREQTIENGKMENHCFWKRGTGKTPFFRGTTEYGYTDAGRRYFLYLEQLLELSVSDSQRDPGKI